MNQSPEPLPPDRRLVLEAAVKSRVAELLRRATAPDCPVRLAPVDCIIPITFDIRGASAGIYKAKRSPGGPWQRRLRFNPDALAIEGGRWMLEEVVPHEVAHLLAHLAAEAAPIPKLAAPFKGHGLGWQMLARWLGASGRTTHNFNLPPGRQVKRFLYRSTCGREVALTSQRHKLVQAGRTLVFPRTGGRVRAENLIGATP